jgi:hypothetical protein
MSERTFLNTVDAAFLVLSVTISLFAFFVFREAPTVTFLGEAAPFLFYGGAALSGIFGARLAARTPPSTPTRRRKHE